ncbi:MAG: NAD(P)H-hydrate dehydratase [Gemmatimonadales bacterium]|nr:MAG: NAD(P)H-hydrate dehydratase [Gemmatimonadales bacterium]
MRASPRIPFLGRRDVALPTGSEAAAFDRWAMERRGVPGTVLMENAGREAARLLHQLVPRGRVAVVVGSGNNGGDGVVLARTLTAWGRDVALLVAGDRAHPDPLLHGWRPATFIRIPMEAGAPDGERDRAAWSSELEGAAVVVDALLGTGIRGAPRAPQARVIQAMQTAAASRPVLALDVPSGVDGDTGAAPGAAVQAEWTVAFGAPKRGTLLHPGRALAGRLLAVEMGFPPWRWGGGAGGEGNGSQGRASGRLITPGWASARVPHRALVTHKNAEGRLLLVAGSPGMAGAAILSARAALAAGAGYLRIATPPELRDLVQLAVPSAVWVDVSQESAVAEALHASDAAAVGPGLGLGHTALHTLRTVLSARAEVASGPGRGLPLLMDADALNLLAAGELGSMDPGPTADGPLLLTPHPGEARRLEGGGPGTPPEPPLDVGLRARAIARRTRATVLLKGNPSVVAGPDSSLPLLYAATSSSSLARAGMGDVLTGVAGALLARGLAPDEAAGVALHLTGIAAWPRWTPVSPSGGAPADAPLPDEVVAGVARAMAASGDGESEVDHPSLLLDLPAPW